MIPMVHHIAATCWLLGVQHLITFIEAILCKQPDAGIIITEDYNHLRILTSAFNLKQLVKRGNRGTAILYKVLTNMEELYCDPWILPPITSKNQESDHCPVLRHPCRSQIWQSPNQIKKTMIAPTFDDKRQMGQSLVNSPWHTCILYWY